MGLYGRCAWTEPGFRNNKRKGWLWETCRVQGVAHHKWLLLALAFATVLPLLLEAEEAAERLAALHHPCKPQHAFYSLFSRGLQRWLYRQDHGLFPPRLPHLAAPSGDAHWRVILGWRLIFHFVRS